jgi:uncharacterized protein YjdB
VIRGGVIFSVGPGRWLLARLAVVAVAALAGGCGRDALRDPGRDAGGGTGGAAGGGGGGTDAQAGRGGTGGADAAADRTEAGTDVRPGSVMLTLQPSVAPPLPVGQSLQWRAFVMLGSPRDVTDEAGMVWSSSNPAIALVTELGGRVTGVSPGRTDIRAQHPLLGSASVSLTVTPAAVARLVVDPAQLRLQPEESRALAARAVYSDNTESDVTFAAQWMSLDQRVAKVGMGAERPGLVTGVTGGNTTVTASFAGAAATAQIAVSPVMVDLSLSISPPMLTRPRGGTAAFRAIARLPSGAITDVTGQASWSSENTMVATPLGAGQFRCNSNASTNVVARFMTASATASLQCATTPTQVVEVRLTKPNSTLFVGLRYGLMAQAVLSDGNVMNLTNTGQVTWSSGDPAIATVDAMGVMTGVAPGTVTISARFSGVTGQQAYTFVAR